MIQSKNAEDLFDNFFLDLRREIIVLAQKISDDYVREEWESITLENEEKYKNFWFYRIKNNDRKFTVKNMEISSTCFSYLVWSSVIKNFLNNNKDFYSNTLKELNLLFQAMLANKKNILNEEEIKQFHLIVDMINIEIEIGKEFWHIDEPNHPYEVVKKKGNNFYALLAHPSFYNAKLITENSIGEEFFETREECLDARIKRAKRNLELEEYFKEKKI